MDQLGNRESSFRPTHRSVEIRQKTVCTKGCCDVSTLITNMSSMTENIVHGDVPCAPGLQLKGVKRVTKRDVPLGMCNSESQTGRMFGIVSGQHPRTAGDSVMTKTNCLSET